MMLNINKLNMDRFQKIDIVNDKLNCYLYMDNYPMMINDLDVYEFDTLITDGEGEIIAVFPNMEDCVYYFDNDNIYYYDFDNDDCIEFYNHIIDSDDLCIIRNKKKEVENNIRTIRREIRRKMIKKQLEIE